MRKKLLYVAPHLSTGGLPQYLYKQICHFKDEFEIEVVEIHNSGGEVYVVQKNRIRSVVPLHTLGEDKSEILNVIKKFKPDIIHFQEIPQYDIASNILDKIFTKERAYYIVATTHGSRTQPEYITYHPDRYVLVSEWSRRKFEQTNVETTLWEYPIYDIRTESGLEKSTAMFQLGLDPTWKHVLNVGLFTEGKNQGEIFAIARQLEKYKIKFHFVGNQAMNFENYWGPLMRNKPDNCIVWGERDDTDVFYAACDLFYFSSKLELNPLSIKEALSYELPCIFRKLDTYLDTYDNNPLVTYITDDLNITKRILLESLTPDFNELVGWFSYDYLYDRMVDSVPKTENSIIKPYEFVEVGAWLGKSTNHMATKIRELGKSIHFTTVDTWKGTDDEELHQSVVGAFNGDIFYEFIDNTIISENYGTFDCIKDTSENASKLFQNDSIDFLLLDAGHSYESVRDDLKLWYRKVKPGSIIAGDDYAMNNFPGVTQAVDEFFYAQVRNENWQFIRKKPKIQVIHLMTRPDDVRERVSAASLKQLEKYGMVYTQMINTPYEGLAPTEHCRRPEHVSTDNIPGELYPGAGLGHITGRHYGCYLAHRGALEAMSDEYDYTLIFEADGFIYTGLEEFVDIVHKACFISERDEVPYISFANNPSSGRTVIDELFSRTEHNQDLAHCYLIPNREKQWWMDRIEDCEWDVADLWYNHVFYHHPRPRYTTNKMYSKQAEGYSLLDQTVKTWNV